MKRIFEAAKWNRNVWAVFDKVTRTFSYIGERKSFCEKKAEELNRLYPG